MAEKIHNLSQVEELIVATVNDSEQALLQAKSFVQEQLDRGIDPTVWEARARMLESGQVKPEVVASWATLNVTRSIPNWDGISGGWNRARPKSG